MRISGVLWRPDHPHRLAIRSRRARDGARDGARDHAGADGHVDDRGDRHYAGARDSDRVNAGQKAYALAEAGINNSLSVLHANYPGTGAFTWETLRCCPSAPRPMTAGAARHRSRTVPPGLGLLARPLWWVRCGGGSGESLRRVRFENPTGPNSNPVTRRATAVVPVVIPPTSPQDPNGPLNFLYALGDMGFYNTVNVIAPVYVKGDLHLFSQAKIKGAAEEGRGRGGSLSPRTAKPNRPRWGG